MKLFKILSWCVALLMLGCVMYVSIVVSEVHQKLEVIEVKYDSKLKEESVIEAGTLVMREDLEEYILFTNRKGFSLKRARED
jgi:hypothetical protein